MRDRSVGARRYGHRMRIVPAVLAVVAALALASPASADDGQDQTTQAICTASDLGESMPQIIHQL